MSSKRAELRGDYIPDRCWYDPHHRWRWDQSGGTCVVCGRKRGPCEHEYVRNISQTLLCIKCGDLQSDPGAHDVRPLFTGRMKVYWQGTPPPNCSRCGTALTDAFLDKGDPLGGHRIVCLSCSPENTWRNQGGPRYGPGRYDREYTKQADGSWLFEGDVPKDYPWRSGERLLATPSPEDE
jgi:hypothetical protein